MGDFGRKVDKFLDVLLNKGGMDSVLQGLQNTLIICRIRLDYRRNHRHYYCDGAGTS